MAVLVIWHWRWFVVLTVSTFLMPACIQPTYYGAGAFTVAQPDGDTSNRHCFFNQLCSCKISNRFRGGGGGEPNGGGTGNGGHSQVDEFGNWDYYDGSPVVTQRQKPADIVGQFGSITTESSKSIDDGPRVSMYRSRLAGRRRGLTQLVHNVQDISCVGVPFTRIPDFPVARLSHLDMVNADLILLENNIVSSAPIESARFMNNKISYIEADAFRATSATLKSLDLSYNALTRLPLSALACLNNLNWLNMHGNEISELEAIQYTNLTSTLNTFFVGFNDILEIPERFFSSFNKLFWLNLDNNHIRSLPTGSLPPSLLTLSIQNNHISKFPMEVVDGLPTLTWCNMRGNYIESIPTNPFRYGSKKFDKLDLGENFITSVPAAAFGSTLTVNDLNLDHNYIESLGMRQFGSLSPRRLYLAHNRIVELDDNVFGGVEGTLELVDLSHNRLDSISPAFMHLRRLKYLHFSNNNVTGLPVSTFAALCEKLVALDLEANALGPTFPSEGLRPCHRLTVLNLGYNRIETLLPSNFKGWAHELNTLKLHNNQLQTLPLKVFKFCPKLRKLSLSFNNLDDFHSDILKELGPTLENLELSFSLRSRYFPEGLIKPLHKLLWLALDNNGIEVVTETALYNQGELQYLNLESNRLDYIPPNLIHQNVHKNLLDVRLSFNRIKLLRSGTFHQLKSLRSVVAASNQLANIESHAFSSLPKLATIILTHNSIERVEKFAFANLPMLQKLELQVSDQTSVANRPPFVQTLDASHNSLTSVPKNFLDFLAPAIRALDLSFNRISEVESASFSLLGVLQTLSLNNNNIMDMEKSSLRHMASLQIIDLSWNRIEVLQFAQMAGLTNLRFVSIAHNRLRSLPRDVFQSTVVESVDLSFNEFVAMPTSALTEVSSTLRSLNMSHNRIEHVDSTMFSVTPRLISLSLANNRLTILPDNVFVGLGALRVLDISYNLLRADFNEMLRYVQRLSNLRLAGVGMEQVPKLPLPQLQRLDLSDNRLTDIHPSSAEKMPQLRHLDISRNSFVRLPAPCWQYLPYLKSLNLAHNPTRVLTKESFYGLDRLQVMVVQHLDDLKRFDADSLAQLKVLTELRVQSWPSIEKFKFRLGSVVSGLSSLRKLSARILEPNGLLTDQILGAFGPKLRELELTGPLHAVTLDAFDGIESQQLTLTIRDTNLKELPKGFHKMFNNVAHLSLDLRNNRLETLHPEVLYTNASQWETIGTKILQGGMALQGNPWKCVCQNTWLARWLLRWMREALQLHTSVVERGQNIQSIVRTITCQTPVDPRSVTSVSHASSRQPPAAASSPSVHDTPPEVFSSSSSDTYHHRSLVDISPENTCRKGARSTATYFACLSTAQLITLVLIIRTSVSVIL